MITCCILHASFDIARIRRVRIQKKRMLFLFVKTRDFAPKGNLTWKASAISSLQQNCNMGIKISPSKSNKFGA